MKKFCRKGQPARSGKRWLALLMSVCLIGTMIPISARAENGSTGTGLCEHHTEHTSECGYVAPVGGHECGHIHDESCGYQEAGECTHVHDDECGYVEASEGSPCTFVCDICGKEAEQGENNLSDETLTEQAEDSSTEVTLSENNVITDWEWVDDWEIIDPDSGNVMLSFASEDNIAYFDDIVEMLPTAILAGGEELTLGEWVCEDYPMESGAYEGEYVFGTTLPEGYVLSEGGNILCLSVVLGDQEGYDAALFSDTPTEGTHEINGIPCCAYELRTADDLFWFAEHINTSNQHANAVLMADITIPEGKTWTPIGNNHTTSFQGKFDGQGYVIRGLKCSDTAYGYAGLFGHVGSSCVILNVGIKDSTFAGTNVGSLCGYATSSGSGYATIKNCYSIASVEGIGHVGGLVGHAAELQISNCFYIGEVTGSGTSMGGCVGWAQNSTVRRCYYNTDSCSLSGVGENYSIGTEAYGKSTEQFERGEVACGLCQGADGEIWGQNVDDTYQKETLPKLFSEYTVYGGARPHNHKGFEDSRTPYCSLCGWMDPDANGVYLISTKDQLYWFAELVNAQNPSAKGVLGKDITLVGGWDSIGKTDKPFTGSFNGNGFTISGLTDTGKLFETIGAGANISSVYISEGSLCETNNGTITSCRANGAGTKLCNTNSGTITNSRASVSDSKLCNTNSGTITNSYASASGSMTLCETNNGTIANCYAAGDNNTKLYGSGSGATNNCYTLAGGTATPVGGTTLTTTSPFASGEVAYLLNQGTMGYSGGVWGQNIGTDSSPLLYGKTVYYKAGGSTEYHNHDGYCSICNSNPPEYDAAKGGCQISNAEELSWFAAYVNGEFTAPSGYTQDAVLTADITVNTGVLNPDGTLSENASSFEAWTPIGFVGDTRPYHQYTGTFDGNGHTISGLYCTGMEYAGLFGMLFNGAEVRNVNISDSYFEGTKDAGGVCGCNSSSTIENSSNTGTVKGSRYVGGVCGQNTSSGSDKAIIIRNCYNTGMVSGGTKIGGVCGYNQSGTIENCYYNSDVFSGSAIGSGSGTNVEGKTTAQFTGGEVAYLLNGGKTDGSQAWYQNIDGGTADKYPTLDSTHGTVYQCTNCTGTYSNTQNKSAQHSYIPCETDTTHECEKCGATANHSTTNFTYTADENTNKITVCCGECEGSLGYVQLIAPTGDLIYNGSAMNATISKDAGVTITNPTIKYKKGETVLTSAPKDAGTYTASITLGTGTGAATVSVEYTINQATPDIGTVSAQKLNGTLDVSAVQLSRSNDTVSGTLSLKEGTTLQYGTHEYTYVFTPIGADAVNYEPVEGKVSITVNVPVSVKIKTNVLKSIFNSFTFDYFFKDTQYIEVEISDSGTDVTKIWYYVSDTALTEEAVKALEGSEWSYYNSSDTSLTKGKYYVYVKVIDEAGNTAYVGTDGIVIYEDSTPATAIINYTYKENNDKTVTVNLNGNTVAAIKDKDGNALIKNTDYSVDDNGTITIKKTYLDGLAVSDTPYILTVSYNPQGETYTENRDELSENDLNDAPSQTVISITVDKTSLTVTGATATGRNYDTTNVVGITEVALNGVKSGDDVAVDTTNLTGTLSGANVDTYTSVTLPTMTLTGADAGSYTLVQPAGAVETNVTISQADAHITVGTETYNKNFGDADFALSDVSDDNTEANVQYSVTAGTDVVSVSNGTVTIKKVGTATITVSLPESTNYNAAENKTITVNVAKKSGYTVTAINKSYLYSRDNEDTIDLSKYLPANYGNVTYGTPQVTGALYTDSGQPAVSNKGELSYTVKQADSSGATGTIKVLVTTGNYEDFTIAVNVELIDKIPVQITDVQTSGITDSRADVSLTASDEGGYGIGKYYLYYTTDSAGSVTADTVKTQGTANTTGTFALSGLAENTSYYLYVMAEDAEGNAGDIQTASFTTKVKAPVISPAGGNHTGSVSVSISAGDSAIIYYTTDGSEPTTDSTIYTQAFTLTASATVKAVAVINGIASDITQAQFTISRGGSSGGSSGGSADGTTDQPENSDNTTTITNEDGSTTTTKTETDANGNIVTTTTTVATDGSTTEKVQTTETNAAGKEVAVTTTTKTDADGNVTGVTEKSVIDNIAKDTTATVTVKTDGDGNVTSAKAGVTKTSDSTKVSLSGKVLDQIAGAAGADVNVRVTMTVRDNDGKTLYKVQADTDEIIPGETLYIYKLDTQTGKYTMVDAKEYKVTKAGTVTVNMTKKATYELVTEKESKAITKEILATVKPAKSSKSLSEDKKTTFKLSAKLDMDNVKSITYVTSRKSVVTVSKKGTITAVKAGTATVKATVTLKNGTKKTIKMTIKVK